jgi:hypothetical protein
MNDPSQQTNPPYASQMNPSLYLPPQQTNSQYAPSMHSYMANVNLQPTPQDMSNPGPEYFPNPDHPSMQQGYSSQNVSRQYGAYNSLIDPQLQQSHLPPNVSRQYGVYNSSIDPRLKQDHLPPVTQPQLRALALQQRSSELQQQQRDAIRQLQHDALHQQKYDALPPTPGTSFDGSNPAGVQPQQTHLNSMSHTGSDFRAPGQPAELTLAQEAPNALLRTPRERRQRERGEEDLPSIVPNRDRDRMIEIIGDRTDNGVTQYLVRYWNEPREEAVWTNETEIPVHLINLYR